MTICNLVDLPFITEMFFLITIFKKINFLFKTVVEKTEFYGNIYIYIYLDFFFSFEESSILIFDTLFFFFFFF